MPRKTFALLILLVSFTLACRALIPGPLRQPAVTPTALSALHSPIRATLPTQTTMASPTQTETPVPPTPTPSATPTRTPTPTFTPSPTSTEPTPTPLGLELQLEVFEKLWGTVNTEYLYPDFNGLDWQAVHEEYHQRIEQGLSNEQFYEAMREMIDSLKDDHSAFLSPQEVKEEDAEFQGNLNYVGIGILASPVTDTLRAVVLVVFPGSPAEAAGLKQRDSILSIDGGPALDEHGGVSRLLRGYAGTWVTIEVQSPGEAPRPVRLQRERISGPVPVPYQVLTSPGGKRIGYLSMVTFADGTIPNEIGQALQAMTASEPLDGLILDNRENEGGLDSVLRDTLGYFTSGKVGDFVNRQGRQAFEIRREDVGGSQHLPLVVLVGRNTVSFGEIFAGIMQTMDRATLIGETTLGNVEILWGYDFDDGSRAWIAHDTFVPAFGGKSNWEATGIIPARFVAGDWYDYTIEQDPGILAALQNFDQPVSTP